MKYIVVILAALLLIFVGLFWFAVFTVICKAENENDLRS